MGIGTVVAILAAGATDTWAPIGALAISVGILSGGIQVFRAKQGRDLVGEGWLSVLRSRLGNWLFALSGVGLGAPVLSAGAPGIVFRMWAGTRQ